MPVVTLAFYKGWGGSWRDVLMDLLIRLGTLSKYSHVEVIPYGNVPLDMDHTSFSASKRDGGVRCKFIHYRLDRWTFIEVPVHSQEAVYQLFMSRKLADYDVLGAALSPLRLKNVHHLSRWYCSEFALYLIGRMQPDAYSPGRLYRWARNLSA